MYKTEQFERQAEEFHISLTGRQMDQFIRYYEILVDRNKMMNLTAITEFDEVMTKHFIDSLSIVKMVDFSSDSLRQSKIVDLGTGAGFPGLPIKIAWPEVEITLADSLNKRILFLNDVIAALKIKGVTTLHGRAEDIGHSRVSRENYDFCVSRAVANISTLSEYCLPLVKKDGYFIAYKSKNVEKELIESGQAIHILGGKVEKTVDFYLPQTDIERTLLAIKKDGNTPKKYPRKAGTPGKEPLN